MSQAAEQYRKQQHEHRIKALGREWLADEWEMVVTEHAGPDGKLDQEKVLDLMLDVYRQGAWMATLPKDHPMIMWEDTNDRSKDYGIQH